MSHFEEILKELSAQAALLPAIYQDCANNCFDAQQQGASQASADAQEAVSLLAQDITKIQDMPSYMAQIGDLYVSWRRQEDDERAQGVVTLPALVACMLGHLGVDMDERYGKAGIVAALLASLPHRNCFHSNAHFRDITCTVFRLITGHEQICTRDSEGRGVACLHLEPRHKALLLIAACVHDFCHDGKGNALDGEHQPMRLEEHAYQKAAPILQAFGLNQDDLHYIRIMILCTDVSYGQQALSPSRILSRCYRYHFEGHEKPAVRVEDYAFLAEALIADKTLCLLAMMMEEADIFASVGLSYDYAKLTTVLVARETEILSSKASTLHGFIEMICHGLLATPAAQTLFSDTFSHVHQQVSKDVQADIDYATASAAAL